MTVPFDATRTIPGDWSRHHQPTAEGGMNAAGVLEHETGKTTRDPDTDQTTRTRVQDWTGTARVQATTSARTPVLGDQQLVGRPYLVQIPADAPIPRPGHIFRVTVCDNDTTLVGRDLYVIDVQQGSELFNRDLTCSNNQTDVPRG